ncbi:hypothetical protein B0H16DRAFT_1882403 [Mycena metata]|uniref:Uncharacterized protein n=1 Tax=Mycena metata TaxID=1033252 RepID=A0AAD7NMK4_9AGAR|nr:hypothetical protein B0H16DRAFT_1882403 [Mycena metata]
MVSTRFLTSNGTHRVITDAALWRASTTNPAPAVIAHGASGSATEEQPIGMRRRFFAGDVLGRGHLVSASSTRVYAFALPFVKEGYFPKRKHAPISSFNFLLRPLFSSPSSSSSCVYLPSSPLYAAPQPDFLSGSHLDFFRIQAPVDGPPTLRSAVCSFRTSLVDTPPACAMFSPIPLPVGLSPSSIFPVHPRYTAPAAIWSLRVALRRFRWGRVDGRNSFLNFLRRGALYLVPPRRPEPFACSLRTGLARPSLTYPRISPTPCSITMDAWALVSAAQENRNPRKIFRKRYAGSRDTSYYDMKENLLQEDNSN